MVPNESWIDTTNLMSFFLWNIFQRKTHLIEYVFIWILYKGINIKLYLAE